MCAGARVYACMLVNVCLSIGGTGERVNASIVLCLNACMSDTLKGTPII